ncbi:MAG: DUF3883 domain-containing protein [Lachnospiraceae bacterium]|nr:DUF3883 domain-containing protein [Lachnospiraceae bacterium]
MGSNLLYYTNKDTLLRLNRLYEKEMRDLFNKLEQGDDNNLEERITAFIGGTDELRKRDQSRKWQKSRIYITQAEVEFSREMQKCYHLYVVFLNERAKKCDYTIFEGDVTGKPLSLKYSQDAERYVLAFDKP